MLKKLKQLNRALRNKHKTLKLSYYCQRYDKAPHSKVQLREIKSLALLRWDNKLGDAIMSGLLVKLLQRYRPDIQVTVITPDFCANWFEKSTNCNTIHCGKRSVETAQSLRDFHGQFDAVVELGTSFDFKELLALHALGASYNIGFNKESHPIFNVCLPKEHIHFKDRYLAVAKLFCDAPESIEIPLIPYSNSTIVDKNTTTIAINLFGSSKYRQFSKTEADKLLNHWLRDFPQDTLYLIPVPGKIEFLKELLAEIDNHRVQLLCETPSLEFSLQLLSQVDLCVTPDTSVVHMASALNTPILAIYADDPRNFQEWHPLSDKAEVVFNPPAKDRNDRVYVHDFEWSELKQKRESLLSSH
ncbi:glycosyltransferase family 9 protein [Vibrio fluvialis]|nr:glycosyltransferase family 9 protein [Vibrio fluvialis]EKO3910290.1 glycosyltransferase family 9 protein [Vibrio fluvialis]MBY8026918.1 hypothetical protein [Vibrio fluvialis]